jgi:hypothetical protein
MLKKYIKITKNQTFVWQPTEYFNPEPRMFYQHRVWFKKNYSENLGGAKKLKEKSEKTLKKRNFCMKALRNHQFRFTKFIE